MTIEAFENPFHCIMYNYHPQTVPIRFRDHSVDHLSNVQILSSNVIRNLIAYLQFDSQNEVKIYNTRRLGLDF